MALVDVSKVENLLKIGPALPALTSFSVIRRDSKLAWPPVSEQISINSNLLRDLLRLALEQVRVDERYYLRSYPDVGEALQRGAFTSPRHHYVEFGYFEDRLPFKIEVDEEFYFKENPDIRDSVIAGLIPSAQVHFERHGYKEGRLPSADWSLLAG